MLRLTPAAPLLLPRRAAYSTAAVARARPASLVAIRTQLETTVATSTSSPELPQPPEFKLPLGSPEPKKFDVKEGQQGERPLAPRSPSVSASAPASFSSGSAITGKDCVTCSPGLLVHSQCDRLSNGSN